MYDVDEFNVRDSRVLYRDGEMVVEAFTVEDETRPEFYGTYGANAVKAFEDGRWEYLSVLVKVRHGNADLASTLCGAIEHGDLDNGIIADAWAWDPAVVSGNTTTMGSDLWSAANEAVNDAWEVLRDAVGMTTLPPVGSPIGRLLRWAAAIDVDEVAAAWDAALAENERRATV